MSRESKLHAILFQDQDKTIAVSKIQIEALIAEVRKNAQLELLNWMTKVASSSLNCAHVRRSAQLRFEEICFDGSPEKSDPSR